MKLFQILLALMLVATVDAKARSFDCATAISLTDRAICASPQVLKLDDELSDVYVRTLLWRSDADDLKTEQKAWVQGTRNRCEDEGCLVKSYVERITALKVASVQMAGTGGGDPASDELTVKIGHVGPTSGALAHLGRDNELAARMAIEDLNAKHLKIGGQVATFQLQAEDDASDPIRAVAAARNLVANNVSGVVGHLNSGASIPASKIYSDAGIPQISPSATNPRYTRQGFKTAFRVVADDPQLASTFGRYAVSILKGKKFAVIADNTAYGHGVADEFEKGVKAAGGTIVGRESTTDKSTEFSAILTKLKSAAPDVLFFGGLDAVAGPMLRQLRELGMPVKFMGPDGVCTAELSELAGDAIGEDMVYCAEAGGVAAKFEQPLSDFKSRFRARNGVEVQMYSPYVYDAVNILADAMVRAGSSEPSKYLPQVGRTDFVGLTGPIAFDEKGDVKNAALTIYTYRHGKREQIDVFQPQAADSGQFPPVELAAAPEITAPVITPPAPIPPMPALATAPRNAPSVTHSISTRENSYIMGSMNRFHVYILLIVGGVVVFIAGIAAVVHRMFRLSRHQTGVVEPDVKDADSQTNRSFDSSIESADARSRPTPLREVKSEASASPDYVEAWNPDDYRQKPSYLREFVFTRFTAYLLFAVLVGCLGYGLLMTSSSIGLPFSKAATSVPTSTDGTTPLDKLTLSELDVMVRKTYSEPATLMLCLSFGTMISEYIDDTAKGLNPSEQRYYEERALKVFAGEDKLASTFITLQLQIAKSGSLGRNLQEHVRLRNLRGKAYLQEVQLAVAGACLDRLGIKIAAPQSATGRSAIEPAQSAAAQKQFASEQSPRELEVGMNQTQRLARALLTAEAGTSDCRTLAEAYGSSTLEDIKRYETMNMRSQAVPIVDAIIRSFKEIDCL